MHTRIALVRKKTNMNQTDFAQKIGLTKNYISLIENGDRTPSTTVIKSICNTYNVNETWLTTGEGEMFNASSEAEELAFLMGVALNDDRAPFRRKLLKIILELPPEEIDKIEAYARKLLEEEEAERQ